MKRLVIALGLSCIAALIAAPAHAGQPTREQLQRASVHYDKGAERYAAGDYSKAILEFHKAFQIVPNALFLYNISLSYEKLDNLPEALVAARKARDFEGLDDTRKQRNQAHIAAWARVVTAEEIVRDLQQIAMRQQKELRQRQAQADTETHLHETTPPPSGGLGGLGWSGIGMTAVGAGLMTGSAVLATSLRSDIDDYEAAAQNHDTAAYDALKADIVSRQRTGKILLFTGAGMGALGVTFLLIDLASGSESPASTAYLGPTSDGQGARVGWRARW